MGSKLTIAVVLCLGIAGASTASAQQQPTGSWSSEASGDQFYHGRGCTDGSYLYVTGGYHGYGSTTPSYYARFRRYDPAANSWFNMPQIASGTATGSQVWGTRYHAAEFHASGGTNRIFIFGGYNYVGSIGSTSYSGGYTNAIRMFTFSSATTGTWSTVSGVTLSSTRYYHAAVTLGDRIYVMGGVSSNANEIFNPVSLAITQGTSLPGYLYYHGAAAVPSLGRIYCLGGYGQSGYAAYNYEYTPQDNDASTNDTGGTWATRANVSNGSAQQNVYYGSAVTLGNRVYLLCGINQTSGAQNNVFEYNPATNTWAQRASAAYGHYNLPAAAAFNGRAYIYGGYPSYYYGEEYTPPDFGLPPDMPTGVAQVGSRAETSLQAQADQNQFDGWTNTQVTFTANVTDPNATQQVRCRVQVKPQAAAWTNAAAITNLDTGLTAQGALALNYTIPTGGGYDWRWRVEDSHSNSYPTAAGTWIEAFDNTTSPDFRSDQLAPADPVAVSPDGNDIQVDSPTSGPVVLNWIESTDNGPVAGISYELQVGDAGFINIEAQLFSSAGTDAYPITLSVSRYYKHWRIRARDVGGNLSQWSPPLQFRVTYDDQINHSSGDAKKSCGFSASGAIPGIAAALFGIALLGFAGLLVSRRG